MVATERGREVGKASTSMPYALRQRPAVGYGLMAPALLVITGILLVPVLFGIYESLFETRRGRNLGYTGLGNYADLITDKRFWSAGIRSLTFVIGCVLVGTVLAVFFASALYRATHGLRFLRGVSIMPWLLSSIGAAVLFRLLFNADYGLPNRFLTLFGVDGPAWLGKPLLAMMVVILAQVWGDLPLSTLVVLGGFLSLDPSQMDAALVDGATGWQRLRFIALPYLAPQISLSAVLLSYHALTSLGIILGLTGGGPANATQTLSVLLYDTAFQRLDYGTSLALMVFILAFNGLLTLGYVGLSRRYGAEYQ